MPKISIFLLNSSENRGKSVIYKRVNRNTVHFKGSAAYIDNSMDHVTRFVSRYSSIYGLNKQCGLRGWYLVCTWPQLVFIWRNQRTRKLRFVNFWISFRGTFHRECMAFLLT